MKESQFKSKVIEYLQRHGYVIKYWGGGRFTRAGVPDIIACINGYFIAIELKTETGRVSKLQEYNIDRINETGGVAIVLRPDGYEQFKNWIKEVKQCPRNQIPKPNIPTLASARSSNVRRSTNTVTSMD